MTLRATRALLRCGFPLALAGLLVSCRHPPAPALPALEVEYQKCWNFSLPDQVCSLFPDPNRRLNLWVRAALPNWKVEIRAGGQLLAATEEEEVRGGRRYRLPIPKQVDRLTVSLLS